MYSTHLLLHIISLETNSRSLNCLVVLPLGKLKPSVNSRESWYNGFGSLVVDCKKYLEGIWLLALSINSFFCVKEEHILLNLKGSLLVQVYNDVTPKIAESYHDISYRKNQPLSYHLELLNEIIISSHFLRISSQKVAIWE
jgi:hypothetical protein